MSIHFTLPEYDRYNDFKFEEHKLGTPVHIYIYIYLCTFYMKLLQSGW